MNVKAEISAEQRELYLHLIQKHGIKTQVDSLIESGAELIKALMKQRKFPNLQLATDRIVQNGVDLQICLEQLRLMFPSVLWEMGREQQLEHLNRELKRED